jgi:hypothetical protein
LTDQVHPIYLYKSIDPAPAPVTVPCLPRHFSAFLIDPLTTVRSRLPALNEVETENCQHTIPGALQRSHLARGLVRRERGVLPPVLRSNPATVRRSMSYNVSYVLVMRAGLTDGLH